jgi:hypothetical protein
VGLKTHLMWAVLLLLTVHMTIEYLMLALCSSGFVVILIN